MSIEADRQIVDGLPIDVKMLASLRETARLTAAHYSTQIEGNRLTQMQVGQAISGARFPGRERDEIEVRNYYLALTEMEELSRKSGELKESDIRRIHGLVMTGKAKSTRYRDGQNVIRDSRSGAIVYMPPEAGDVPALVAGLVAWINAELQGDKQPAPLIAALAHYQFATIHPYFDGNGRTARLLTTLILHKAGYGLKGIYSLDEYYARNLDDYYEALTVGKSHNYYFGRERADVTGFVDYFCRGMADAFYAVRLQASNAAARRAKDISARLKDLDPRQRKLLALFRRRGRVTTAEVAAYLRLSHRTVLGLCRLWVRSGFLVIQDPSRKSRAYTLGEQFGLE